MPVGATATVAIGSEWRARGPEALAAAMAAQPASASTAGSSASEDE
jgi:hypothetical protein